MQVKRTGTLGVALLTALSIGLGNVLPLKANADNGYTPSHHRHATAKAAAAGIGAYALAKHTGDNRARNGRRRNFAQRHPVLSGIAAAAVVHHYAKRSHHSR